MKKSSDTKIDPYSPVWNKYRKILHIDLDAFFASVEQRDNPSLVGLPIAVGLNKARGVVASCSYEARKFGVHSAQPSHLAAKLCPNLIFVEGRMEAYKEASENILEIFRRYTELIEPVSIDEAFLDVTQNRLGLRFGVDCAKAIKKDIRKEVGLVASAGVSYNKFLAKIASDWKKPDGLFVIHPAKAQDFIDKLPVKAIWGVGPVTQKKMESLDIHTCSDLRKQSLFFLTEHFGKAGLSYYNYARGIDDRPLRVNRIRKQVSAEITFSKDLSDLSDIQEGISRVVCQLKERMTRRRFRGFSLTLKVRMSDFKTFSRSHTFDHILEDPQEIYEESLELLSKLDLSKKVRLIGIGIGSPLEVEQEELLPFLEF
ncbi:DNA polymerase IV [Turicimonas sp. TL08]